MTSFQKHTGDSMQCPHCGASLDDCVDDYVIPGRIGPRSAQKHACWDCERTLRVEFLGNDLYEITPL